MQFSDDQAMDPLHDSGASAPNPPISPFRGPRSFQTGDTLYGRDREARALLATLIAERIVLLHSPSGAGKTSLVQAALVPDLLDREFTVLPVVRVGAAPEPGFSGNRYVRSTLITLEEGLPAEERLPAAELDTLSLAAYLARRIPEDADPVLIFDQFEEVLTRDPTDTEAKHDFFAELGLALRERRYRALFSMREDYVAALEPFLRHVPTRLAVHFRLDLLGVEGGQQALAEPVRQLGVAFPDTLVSGLIDDLRVVNVQQADGTIAQQLGPNVEPVQLQILGLRLWSRLAPGAQAITAADVQALGDVGSALGDYYAEQVAVASSTAGVQERSARAWFDRELITPQAVRGQVLQGPDRSGGLENRAIRALIDAYLVRAEPRRGATWFELAHDRLIAPIRASNAAWEAANLSTLQRQADLWERQGRPAGLLLRDQTLREAEEWAAANASTLTETDQAFLQLCREARSQARRVRNLAIGASILAVAASLAFVTALWFFNRAEQQRRLAVSRELAAAAVSNLPLDPQRSLILGLAAAESTAAAGEPVTPEARQALYRATQTNRVLRELPGHSGDVRAVAYSPDGSLIATTGVDGTVRLWDAEGTAGAVLTGHADEVNALAFSPDGATLASAGFEGEIVLWDVAGAAERQRIAVGAAAVTDLAFSPDGTLLAASDDSGTLTLWDPAAGAERGRLLATAELSLEALAFSSDGARIAVGGEDFVVRVWPVAAVLAGGEPEPELTLSDMRDEVLALAFSPDGAYLAASGQEQRVVLWDATSGTIVAGLVDHAGAVYGLAFNADGSLLGTASSDGTAKIWRVDTAQPLLTLAGHSDFVYGIAFSPAGGRVATASLDDTARIWSLDAVPSDGTTAVATSPDGNLIATIGERGLTLWDAATGAALAFLPGPEALFSTLAFSPDGTTLALGDYRGLLQLYAVDALLAGDAEPLLEFNAHMDSIDRLAYSPDGARLASASSDQSIRVWDSADGAELLVLEGFQNWVYGLAFSPDGTRLAGGDQSGLLIVFDQAGNEVGRVDLGLPIAALAYSADGATLAVASDDGNIYRYEAGLSPLAPLRHGASLNMLLTRSNGELFAGGLDGRISRWAADGTALDALPASASVYSMAPLPDERLVSVGADGVAHIFPLALDDLLADARAGLIRGPTAEECAGFQLNTGCR